MFSKVLIIGMGEIARTHLLALERIEGTEVVGADIKPPKTPRRFRGEPVKVYKSAREALDNFKPTAVIIATPTHNHWEVLNEVLRHATDNAHILLEKPCADSWHEVQKAFELTSGRPFDVMLHEAYSSETLWAVEQLKEWQHHFGPVKSYEASFVDINDGPDKAHRREVLKSSWLDLGINAISQMLYFVQPQPPARIEAVREGLDYHAEFRPRSSGPIIIDTNWVTQDKEMSHKVKITFDDGAELNLDLTKKRGSLLSGGEIVDAYSYTEGLETLEDHYLNMFRALAEGKYLSHDYQLLAHRLLLENHS